MQISGVLRNFLLIYIVLHFGMVGLFLLTITESQQRRMLEQTQQRMHAMAVSLQQSVADTPNQLFDQSFFRQTEKIALETNVRISLISADGTVLSDTRVESTELENHSERPEIIAAQNNTVGTDRRVSNTIHIEMYYLAVRLEDPTNNETVGFIRIAVDTQPIDDAIAALTLWTWVFAIVLGLVAGSVTWYIAAKQMSPLSTFADVATKAAEGNYTRKISSAGHRDEWETLAVAFEKMQSELTKRESKLTESNQRFRTIFETMSDGLLLIGTNGTVITTNNAARELLSLDEHDITGRSIVEAIRIPEFQNAIEATVITNRIQNAAFETIGESRRKLYMKVIPLPGDEPSGMILAVQDRTQLEQLSTMRTDFVASVSHELKTPLASIKAYAETLRMIVRDEPEHAERFLAEIESAADQLTRQIGDLLQLARIESGRETFHAGPVDIDDHCRQSIEKHARAAEHRQVAVSFKPNDTVIYAYADDEAVQTIIDNLISNAIRYARPQGEVKIATFTDNGRAVIEVSDNGIGIAPQHHDRVFERFYRVDKARSRDLGGTGLGLSIVKHLANSFGGNVRLNSALGRGSTFKVYLPLEQKIISHSATTD